MRAFLVALLVCASLGLWFATQRQTPPGFHMDESSIALNALTIARHGTDEQGVRYPLFFRAFGEYKNPVIIYLLAATFEVVDPSQLTARRLSASLGWLAAAALGLLGWQMTRSLSAACAAFAMAIATPALFEISRLALEVAVFPLAVGLFLLAAWRAWRAARWSPLLIGSLVVTLTLVTYGYTAGRLMGPLLAVLLALLATRRRDVLAVWALYGALALLPALVYHVRHDGALTRHPTDTSLAIIIVDDPIAGLDLAFENVRGVTCPVDMVLRGDPNPRYHVPKSGGSLLLATFILAPLGLAAGWDGRWSIFLIAGAMVAVAPAALSDSVQHSLRYAGYPMFLIAMATPAFASLRFRRIVAVAGIAAIIQASWFHLVFHRTDRSGIFHTGVPAVVAVALAQPSRPIYVRDYRYDRAQTLWYALSHGARLEEFVRLPKRQQPPPNAVCVDGAPPDDCTILARTEGLAAYRCP